MFNVKVKLCFKLNKTVHCKVYCLRTRQVAHRLNIIIYFACYVREPNCDLMLLLRTTSRQTLAREEYSAVVHIIVTSAI